MNSFNGNGFSFHNIPAIKIQIVSIDDDMGDEYKKRRVLQYGYTRQWIDIKNGDQYFLVFGLDNDFSTSICIPTRWCKAIEYVEDESIFSEDDNYSGWVTNEWLDILTNLDNKVVNLGRKILQAINEQTTD